MPRVLFVESQCSFTWNLIDALPVARNAVRVCTAHEAAGLRAQHDVLVLGPGPTDPERAGLVQLARDSVLSGMPVLGVCLGHQALGLAFGADLVRDAPMHGKVRTAVFTASRLLPGFEGAFEVMRYHSLRLENMVSPWRAIARCGDGAIMAMEHQTLPALGLQFHPDSYATPHGERMISAFFQAVCA